MTLQAFNLNILIRLNLRLHFSRSNPSKHIQGSKLKNIICCQCKQSKNRKINQSINKLILVLAAWLKGIWSNEKYIYVFLRSTITFCQIKLFTFNLLIFRLIFSCFFFCNIIIAYCFIYWHLIPQTNLTNRISDVK